MVDLAYRSSPTRRTYRRCMRPFVLGAIFLLHMVKWFLQRHIRIRTAWQVLLPSVSTSFSPHFMSPETIENKSGSELCERFMTNFVQKMERMPSSSPCQNERNTDKEIGVYLSAEARSAKGSSAGLSLLRMPNNGSTALKEPPFKYNCHFSMEILV